MPHNPLLLLIGIPIIAGLACIALTDKYKKISVLIAFIATLLSFALSLSIFLKKPITWQTGQSVVFIANNLSSFLILAISMFALLVTAYSSKFINRSFGRYFGCVLFTLGFSFGAALANHLIVLSVFWGGLAVTLFLLTNIDGTKGAVKASQKALIMVGGTDALMIFGMALIWSMTGTFSMDKIHIELNGAIPLAAYLSLAIAAFAKAGAVPVHSWLPDVAEHAPASVTAYLPASLDKLLGIYLLAKISLDLFVMNSLTNFILLAVGAITIISAVMLALVQHDFKRLLGYHAVSQVGYMVMGIGTGNAIGIAGGLFHMLNHAIYKSCLFLAGGNVEQQAKTTDLSKLGGLAKYMPVTFAGFLVASLAISGIPPLNGFVSKWMIYQGIIESAGPKNYFWVIWLVSAMFGSALTIASFMKLLHAIFLGRASDGMKDAKEAAPIMLAAVTVLAGLCILFGVFAFKIPLPLFILNSIGTSPVYKGMWTPVAATILISIGILAGLLIYRLLKASPFRTVETFIGGEDQASLDRVSGVEFYDTIKDLKTLRIIYRKDKEGSLDIYNIGRSAVSFVTRIGQRLHNGILPTYLVWCLLGMIVILGLLIFI